MLYPLPLLAYTLTVLMSITSLRAYEVNYTITRQDQDKQALTITFTLKPGEILYKESFYPTVNNAHVTLSQPTTDAQAITFFDEAYNHNKEGYKDTVTFLLQAQKERDAQVPEAQVHLHFATTAVKQPQQKLYP
jgi:thiol:disulfide interchange protein